MVRIILGGIAGFVSWLIVWIGTEKILSAVWPAFGVNQKAFQEAIMNRGADSIGFTADTTMLCVQLVQCTIVSLLAGALAALIAGKDTYAPLIAGFLLLAMGIAKAVMSWQYVPIWYHVIFTALLLPMAIVGGKLLTK